MSTATNNGSRNDASVEQYIANNPNADPKALLDVLMQQNVKLREESRSAADVSLDEKGEFRPKNLAGLWRLAQMYAQSSMVPDHYKNKPADCAIAIQMAMRCKVNILTFMQASYIVHGRPGIEAKLMIALINASGQIKGRIRFRFEGQGKSRQCTAYAIDANTGESLEQTVTWAMVEAEGWNKKSGSKWLTIPDLMFQYRAGSFLGRVFFPDVLMGMYSKEELDDIEANESREVPMRRPISNLDELADQLMGADKSEPLSVDPEPKREQVESSDTTEAEQVAEVAAEDAKLLDDLPARFAECTTLAEVTKVYEEASKRPLSTDQHFQLDSWHEQAMEAVRSTRGTRSGKAEQKSLGV